MSRKWKIVLGIVAVSTVVLVTWPVYAHCGKCASSGKDMVKLMEEGKLNLGKAIEIAEKHSKGKAVAAYCELEGDGLEISVYCLVGDKIMEVEIDGKTGKVMEMEEKSSLPSYTEEGHAHEHAVAARIVEAGCAGCIFNMEGRRPDPRRGLCVRIVSPEPHVPAGCLVQRLPRAPRPGALQPGQRAVQSLPPGREIRRCRAPSSRGRLAGGGLRLMPHAGYDLHGCRSATRPQLSGAAARS